MMSKGAGGKDNLLGSCSPPIDLPDHSPQLSLRGDFPQQNGLLELRRHRQQPHHLAQAGLGDPQLPGGLGEVLEAAFLDERVDVVGQGEPSGEGGRGRYGIRFRTLSGVAAGVVAPLSAPGGIPGGRFTARSARAFSPAARMERAGCFSQRRARPSSPCSRKERPAL